MQVLVSRAVVFSIGCVILFISLLGLASRPPAAQPLWELVESPTYPDRDRAAQQPWLIREQKILFNQPTLNTLRDLTKPAPSAIVASLFGETNLEFFVQSRAVGPLASTVVQGRHPNAPQGDITLVLKDDVVAGTIHFNQRVLKIEYVGNGEHRLVEIDPEKLPPD